MADYKDIVGTAVRNNAGTLTSAKTGELFYDSTNLDFIYRHPNVTTAGSWRTGGNTNLGRRYGAGTGTQTAALLIGGYQPGQPNSGNLAQTEEYNGASWASGGELSSNRKVSVGFGLQNAAVQTGNYQCSAWWTKYGTSNKN